MKKHILLLILISIISLAAKAQFTVSYTAGYGHYKMDDMKNMLNNILKLANSSAPTIPYAIVNNFPGYVTHTADFSYRIQRHEFGIRGSYLTTGGKVAYSDYSGEHLAKLTNNGYRIGLNYRFYQPIAELSKLGNLSLFAEISPAITFSKLKTFESKRIFTEQISQDEAFDIDANGISILPQIGIKWQIIPMLGIHASGGYDIQLGSHFSMNGQKTSLKSDWSGFRIGGGVSFTFTK